MGEIEFGKCDICGKEAPLSRTYFVYDIHCECCGCKEDGRDMHSVLVRHCKDCVPDIPQLITPTVKSKIDNKGYILKIEGMRPYTIRGKFCIQDFQSQYKHVYALRNKDTGNYLLTYWASSQKHKALFSSRKKAEDAVKWIDANIEIVEL